MKSHRELWEKENTCTEASVKVCHLKPRQSHTVVVNPGRRCKKEQLLFQVDLEKRTTKSKHRICHPSYMEGWNKENHSSTPAPNKKVHETSSQGAICACHSSDGKKSKRRGLKSILAWEKNQDPILRENKGWRCGSSKRTPA
jgi:hypothetical protein